MLKRLKAHLRKLEKDGTPGTRFQTRYARDHRPGKRRPMGGRILRMLGAVVAIIIGAFFAVMPGPAIWFFLLGGILLSTEFLIVAKALDFTEVRGRKLFTWLKHHWRPLSPALKGTLVCVGALMSATAAYFSFRIMHG